MAAAAAARARGRWRQTCSAVKTEKRLRLKTESGCDGGARRASRVHLGSIARTISATLSVIVSASASFLLQTQASHTHAHTRRSPLCFKETHRSSARARRISASLSAVTPPISPARRNCRIIRMGYGKTVASMDDGTPLPATELLSPPPPLAARSQTDVWFQKQKRLGGYTHLSPVRRRSLFILSQKGVASSPVLLIPVATSRSDAATDAAASRSRTLASSCRRLR